MRWTWGVWLVVGAIITLVGCGEKHTYAGKIRRVGMSDAVPTEATFTKNGDTEATLTFDGGGELVELARCTYPIKLKLSDGTWSPDGCSFKTKLDRTEVEMNTTLVGRVEIKGGSMTLVTTMIGMPSGDVRFEFEGKEK